MNCSLFFPSLSNVFNNLHCISHKVSRDVLLYQYSICNWFHAFMHSLLFLYLHFRSLYGQFCKAQFVRNEQRVSKSICQSNHQWTVCRFHSSWCENHEETSPYTSWETQWMCTGAENYCVHLLRLQTIFPHIKITQTQFFLKEKIA